MMRRSEYKHFISQAAAAMAATRRGIYLTAQHVALAALTLIATPLAELGI